MRLQTDRRTDRRTDGRGDSSIPPLTSLGGGGGGYNNIVGGGGIIMIDLSIYLLSEIKSMAKSAFYSSFPDKNAAWAMSLNAQEMNQAEKIISVS